MLLANGSTPVTVGRESDGGATDRTSVQADAGQHRADLELCLHGVRSGGHNSDRKRNADDRTQSDRAGEPEAGHASERVADRPWSGFHDDPGLHHQHQHECWRDGRFQDQQSNGQCELPDQHLPVGLLRRRWRHARHTIQHQSTTAIVQPNRSTDPATGLVDAGNWQVTDSWTVPTDAMSGVYVANIVDGSQVFQIPFIIKDGSSNSDIVFQTADETWQAYNGWGGANLYGGNGPGHRTGAAYAVSYNRPITTRDSSGVESGPQDTVFGAEYSAIYWLEQNGYDVSYISGMDTATNGSLLLNHKIFMDAGHDEYWTDSQVANVQAAANAGVNLAFLSGNEIFWQTQFEPSIDGSATANRTLVTYKDSHFQTIVDPNGIGTGTFEAPANWGGAGMPSNALTGTVFQVDETTSWADHNTLWRDPAAHLAQHQCR